VGNDRLRSTLRSTGFTGAKLAEELGVDPKTIQRWTTTGRTPHRNTATRAGRILGVPPEWLWPDLDQAESGSSGGEVVAFYAHRSQVPKNCWLELVVGARERIDLLTYASLFLPEDNPESIQILRHKAENGVPIRIALGNPDTPELELRGREERLYDGLLGRVRMALAYYRPLLGVPNVTFHLHQTALYNSIFRFDDQMMVNQHIYGTYGYLAPILHLRKVDTSDLFATYERSFEMAWEESYPYEPAA
jgi:transcriptional regulator with XRE-family HTH domain